MQDLDKHKLAKQNVKLLTVPMCVCTAVHDTWGRRELLRSRDKTRLANDGVTKTTATGKKKKKKHHYHWGKTANATAPLHGTLFVNITLVKIILKYILVQEHGHDLTLHVNK